MRNLTTSVVTTSTGKFIQLIDPTTGEMHERISADAVGPKILWNDVTVAPAATGNTGVLPRFERMPDGTSYFVDAAGVAYSLGGPDIVTTLDNTVTGHAIGQYHNEAGATVTINETITRVDNASFNATTGVLSFDYYDEAGVKTTAQTTIPIGDKYKTASTTCNDIVSTGQLTFNVGTGLAYTALQDIIAYADGSNHMNGHVISYDSATGVLVMEVDQKTGAGNYCNWTFNLDAVQAAALVETTTTLTSTVAGHKIGTYFNEVNAAVDINETLTTLDSVTIVGTLLTIKYTGEDGIQVTKTATIPSELPTGGTSGQVLTINPDGTYGWATPATTTVSVTQTVTSGTELATVTVNGVATKIYAPVDVDPVETTGYGTDAPTTPGTVIGSEYYVTPLGTAADAANATAAYRWDGTQWVKYPVGGATAASALWVDATTSPTATGNTGTLPRFVNNTVDGTKWYIDSTGVAKKIEAGTACGVVYFDQATPATSTIFSHDNPPLVNDPSLQNLDCAIYISAVDGSVWNTDGSGTYKTKVDTAPLHQFQTDTATASMATITLAKTPILGSTGKVRVSRNGVDVTRAFTWVGNVGTYNAANNYGCIWDAGDIWQAEYEAY